MMEDLYLSLFPEDPKARNFTVQQEGALALDAYIFIFLLFNLHHSIYN
jgi:hypothetical protein